MQVSVAITVLNEEETIIGFLKSLFLQKEKPVEIILVDGGSKDKTVELIGEFKKKHDKNSIIKLVVKKDANRPEGRNIGIELAKSQIIAITDAGCVLDKNWLKEIIAPFKNPNVDVVSGYYKTGATSIFEQCLGCYTLVMPDRVNPSQFLPSARSMAIRKKVWQEAGGFPEHFPLNEDYVFAQTLKKMAKNFYFARKAIVYWKPRENLKKAFLMFYYFAKGDAQARILRPKVILIFIRYLIGIMLFTYSFKYQFLFSTFYLLLITYVCWAVFKNYKYARHWQALFFLPLLQFTSDMTVITGTMAGFITFKDDEN